MRIATIVHATTLPSMIATALVAMTCASLVTTAQASEPGQPLTKRVAYSDLNLDSEQGANLLYVRLRLAAQEVCRPYEGAELPRHRIWQVCVDRAIAAAVGQINRPMLTAVHHRGINRSSAG
jgi:UrcA family protein